MARIEDTGPPLLQPCPSCGLTDEVAGVPAVYHAGRDSVRITTPARFDDPEETVTRSVTTSLSGALEPAPGLLSMPSPLGCLAGMLGLVSIGTFIAGAAAGHWFSDRTTATHPQNYPFDRTPVADSPRPDFAFLGWISALALVAAIALFVRAAKHRSARKRLLAGRAAAERLWSRGWYCARCGTVHFRTESGEEATALTLQEFRALVWEAGGYGHLVEGGPRQPMPRARRRA
ncbi:hypothetical protein AB0K51_18295 [Kitasatospora sp. NPDC049285]|uniref:hypothetical protein n=1 Tax=Kitasatospora sp. NPDC049285 TaxID=3157096 RepID=UPI00343D0361